MIRLSENKSVTELQKNVIHIFMQWRNFEIQKNNSKHFNKFQL